MNNNLLIVGAGAYAVVAFEIATDMGIFERIDFVDDMREVTPNHIRVIGTTQDINALCSKYKNIVVGIGNSELRLSILNKIKNETLYNIATLVSPKAHISPSAQIKQGSIIEPFAIVHACSVISDGCIISAGAVVNHNCVCFDGVHVDCNATVSGGSTVPIGYKVCSGEVYRGDSYKN